MLAKKEKRERKWKKEKERENGGRHKERWTDKKIWHRREKRKKFYLWKKKDEGIKERKIIEKKVRQNKSTYRKNNLKKEIGIKERQRINRELKKEKVESENLRKPKQNEEKKKG